MALNIIRLVRYTNECTFDDVIIVQVKESPVASDSLLNLDLKSGSKVNIGTYAITLDKFFEGQLKVTRAFDIGNGKPAL